jgi:hypothetical protein
MSDIIFVTEKSFSVRAREVIRELGKTACVLLRVSIIGPRFPHRDSEPWIRILGEGDPALSLVADVSEDQKELRGYFPVDTKLSGRAEFGYGGEIIGSVPLRKVEPERLDRQRVEVKVREITNDDLGPFKAARRRR